MIYSAIFRSLYICLIFVITFSSIARAQDYKNRPNVIFIYADDLGYGDVSSYGATQISTPNLDKLSSDGIRFTNAYSTSATCTPSRFALMTGEYPWRREGTSILPGNAQLIIPTDQMTLPKVYKKAGYTTAIVGKWHLGLGDQTTTDWNSDVRPGPLEVGFDYSFIFPATADRVPTVFLENHNIIGLDPTDPIEVDYNKKVGNDPTGTENPELLKMKSSPNHGHNNTIVNGIGRIGYMKGGHKARWVDEEISTTFLQVAKEFIKKHQKEPFFLFLPMTEPHVPRMPATYFKGKSKLGYRGDAILQLDWTIGQIMEYLTHLGIKDNTIIFFTSDNGPVLNDGYEDDAVSLQNGHQPAGPFRGGKYSVFEGGTRVPFIVSGSGVQKGIISNAMISQIDFLASSAQLLGQKKPKEARDSQALWPTLVGKSLEGRTSLIQHAGTLAIRKGNWKYIKPANGPAYNKLTQIELGNSLEPQLYDLENDPGEQHNVASLYPEIVKELKELLDKETR